MDIHIRCYHSPSIRILHCCRCCHYCNRSCTSRIHHHMGCLMSIRSLRSKHCSHYRNQVLRMGIHIRILCMGCKHRSSMILSYNLRNQRTSNFHNHHHSSFHGMDIHIRCYHSPSIRILHCCRCCHYCNRSCTSRIHHHMGCLMSIRSLRSKHCSHYRNQVLRMGIHIRILCMGCILRSLMMTGHLHSSQRTSRYHSHIRSNLRGMDIHIRCYHNPSIRILHCCHCYHHSNRSCTSRIHHHLGCLMSIHSLRSKHCSHCRS